MCENTKKPETSDSSLDPTIYHFFEFNPSELRDIISMFTGVNLIFHQNKKI